MAARMIFGMFVGAAAGAPGYDPPAGRLIRAIAA
jgi:hypothetical protein